VRAMAAAIGAAHRAGVVHRDFKSENVMLAAGAHHGNDNGDDVRVVVMDFGLARNSTLSTQDSLEGRGLAGTLAYMAPEQLDGQRAGHPSDIYALGVVMYEMLAGQLPFVPPPGEPGLAAVLTRLSEPAPPLKSLIPNIDDRWNDVVARCLEREIGRRFASADDVVRALSDEVSSEGTAGPVGARAAALPAAMSAAPSVAPAAAPRRAWRRAGLVAVGVGGLVALVAAFPHRPAPAGDAAKVAPVLAPSLSPSAPAEPPKAEAAAPPKIADEAAPDPSAAARPETAADVDRHPAARRPNAPRTLRRDPTAAAAAPKRGNNTPPPPTPTNAAEPDAPKPPKPRPRSADPNDGFIFQ
jgi:hypothetical protein